MSTARKHEIRGKLQELYTSVNEEANKVKSSLQGKYSSQIAQKDEFVEKAANALIETVNKLRNALHSK